MVRITVDTKPRSYDAIIENGVLAQSGEYLRQMLDPHQRLFVVTVPPVRRKWGRTLSDSLASAGWHVRVLEVPDGERSKQLSTVEILAEKVAAQGADRNSAIIAFGGGVVGDLGGMLASLF